MARPLTDKQQAFVQEYLVDCNASKAALRAGYSKKTAHKQGTQLLAIPGIAKAIAAKKARRAKRVEITADRVLTELAHIAFADIGDVLTVGEDGTVQVNPLDQVDESARRAIGEITQTSTERLDQDGRTIEKVRTSLKHHPKLQALNLLCKHLGIASDKMDLSVVTSLKDQLGMLKEAMPPESFADLLKAIAKGQEGAD